MRHKKRGRKLGRTPSHREALRRNMAKALFEHERIVTTEAKAKETKSFIEKLITLARKAVPYRDSEKQDERAKYLHYFRKALGKLQDKKMVQKLFGEGEWREKSSLGERYLDRPGGYTRIIRLSGSRLGIPMGDTVGDIPELIYEMGGRERRVRMIGNRLGDNAKRVIFELVEEQMPGEEGEEEEEVAPVVTLSDEADEEPEEVTDEDKDAVLEEEEAAEEEQQEGSGAAEAEASAEEDEEPTADPGEETSDENSEEEKEES